MENQKPKSNDPEKKVACFTGSNRDIMSHYKRRLVDFCSSKVIEFKDKAIKSAFIELKRRLHEDFHYATNCLNANMKEALNGGIIPPFTNASDPYKKKKKHNGNGNSTHKSFNKDFNKVIDKETSDKLKDLKKDMDNGTPDNSRTIEVKQDAGVSAVGNN